jgi:hypothetical protein
LSSFRCKLAVSKSFILRGYIIKNAKTKNKNSSLFISILQMQVAKLIPVALSIDIAINKSSNYILGRRNEYF